MAVRAFLYWRASWLSVLLSVLLCFFFFAVFVKTFGQPEKFLSAQNSKNFNQKLNFKKRSKLFNDLSMLQKICTLLLMTRNTS